MPLFTRRSVKSSAKSRSKKYGFRPRTRSAAPSRPVSSVRLSALVRRIANRGTEVKHVGQNVVDARFNSTISSASECYRILPDVTEGVAGHQRIGDKIRPKYLVVKGKLMYDVGIAGTEIPPSTCRLLILTQKDIKASNMVAAEADVDHLLKDNIGTDVARAYSGTNFDNLAPINKDLFTVHMDRKIKMRAQFERALGTPTDPILGYATQRAYYWTARIRCPSTLTFDDGNINTPNNFAPFFCMGSVTDDNSGPWTANTPYRVTVQSELYYTDV